MLWMIVIILGLSFIILTFFRNTERIVGKSLKALIVLLNKCKSISLKPKTLLQLFDSFVSSISCYGSEICGFSKSKEIERLHLQFCKRILNVK